MNKRTKGRIRGGARPTVVEIVGLAGAGKSTLTAHLASIDGRFRVLGTPDCRRAADLPFFIGSVLQVLPDYLQLSRTGSHFLSAPDLAQMAILFAWKNRLPRDLHLGSFVLIDQGPIFMTACLKAFGPSVFGTKAAEQWWEKVGRQWAATLDGVVLLEADDATLQRRVRERDRWHALNEQTDREAVRWMGAYRAALREAAAAFGRDRTALMWLTFNSAEQPIEVLAEAVRRDLLVAAGNGRRVHSSGEA